MKKTNLSMFRLSLTVMALAGLTACKKNANDQATGDRSLHAGITAACDCATVPPTIGDPTDSTISGVISSNLYLGNTKNYKLDKLVFVSNNATLTIAAGARIVGLAGVGTPGTPGATPGGGLVITRGSKIQAVGTSQCPIIFTSYRYNASPLPGDWSGVVILGKSTSNQPTTTQVEGIGVHAPLGVDIGYGGSVPADNSGALNFVRIEYAGWELETDKEINGLTMAGVGSGTSIDYVEVYKANDDAFEWFGGTVNASHLIAVDALDDMFDTDHGYSGTISYALGLADTTRADKSQSNGFESDNSNISAYNQTPLTHPVYQYVTIIGLPNLAKATRTNMAPSSTGSYGRAAHLRRNAEFDISNSIFMGFKYGISLDGEKPITAPNSISKYFSGTSTLTNNFVHSYLATPSPYITENNALGASFADPAFYNMATTTPPSPNNNRAYNTANPNTTIKLINPFTRDNTNAAANYLTTAGALGSPNNIQGAFPNRSDWTIVNGCFNWTRYKD
jgi:hypothetical protein